jgi:NAD+ kinase
MKVAIYGRVFKKEHGIFIQEVYNRMHHAGIDYCTEELFLAQCVANNIKVKDTTTYHSKIELLKNNPDFFIVLGGDGTMLDSLVYIYNTKLPVLGINMGRLGFLTGENKTDIKKLFELLERGYFTIDKRTVLKLESNTELFEGIPYSLNDFVIHKKDSSSMMTIHTYLNGEFLNSYWADGLIVSTPTGSTGYSLSCGGPILYPGSDSCVITPIAPHNLNVRPMVISDSHVISFEIEDRSTSFLVTLDSRSETISSSASLAIRKADFQFHLLRFNDENFLQTLRKKLMWGVDNRNQ